jgi:hypothetical protein
MSVKIPASEQPAGTKWTRTCILTFVEFDFPRHELVFSTSQKKEMRLPEIILNKLYFWKKSVDLVMPYILLDYRENEKFILLANEEKFQLTRYEN